MFGLCRKKKRKILSGAKKNKHHILILGSGESGKTTIVKQLSYIYGNAYGQEKRKQYTQYINENLVDGIKALGIKVYDQLDPSLQQCCNKLKHRDAYSDLTCEDADMISRLWKSPLIQNSWLKFKTELQLPDGLEYLFSRTHIVCQSGYIPTHDDILRVRKRTTGIIEAFFHIGDVELSVIDVGGQRSERRKWVHAFDNVSAILFVVALPSFDQVMWEDDKINRLTDSLHLFEKIINLDIFIKKNIVLFLNKKDLFKTKIKHVNLKDWCPDYHGRENNYADGIKYLTKAYLKRNRNQERKIFTHLTNATNPTEIENAFQDVLDLLSKHEPLIPIKNKSQGVEL